MAFSATAGIFPSATWRFDKIALGLLYLLVVLLGLISIFGGFSLISLVFGYAISDERAMAELDHSNFAALMVSFFGITLILLPLIGLFYGIHEYQEENPVATSQPSTTNGRLHRAFVAWSTWTIADYVKLAAVIIGILISLVLLFAGLSFIQLVFSYANGDERAVIFFDGSNIVALMHAMLGLLLIMTSFVGMYFAFWVRKEFHNLVNDQDLELGELRRRL